MVKEEQVGYISSVVEERMGEKERRNTSEESRLEVPKKGSVRVKRYTRKGIKKITIKEKKKLIKGRKNEKGSIKKIEIKSPIKSESEI